MTPNNSQRIPAFSAHIDRLRDVGYRNVTINDKGFTPNTSHRIPAFSAHIDTLVSERYDNDLSDPKVVSLYSSSRDDKGGAMHCK
jgi:hypothetical protein